MSVTLQRTKTSTADPEPLGREKGKKEEEGEFAARGRTTKKTGFERDVAAHSWIVLLFVSRSHDPLRSVSI